MNRTHDIVIIFKTVFCDSVTIVTPFTYTFFTYTCITHTTYFYRPSDLAPRAREKSCFSMD